MFCSSVDASISMAVYVPFGSIYHSPKWIWSCTK